MTPPYQSHHSLHGHFHLSLFASASSPQRPGIRPIDHDLGFRLVRTSLRKNVIKKKGTSKRNGGVPHMVDPMLDRRRHLIVYADHFRFHKDDKNGDDGDMYNLCSAIIERS